MLGEESGKSMIGNVPKVQSVPGLQELGGQAAGAARGRGCVVRVEASGGGYPTERSTEGGSRGVG